MKTNARYLILFAWISLSMGFGTFADDTQPLDFAHQVVPILKEHCVECHGGDSSKGGFSMNTRELFLDAKAVKPGQANQSLMIQLATSDDPEEWMPPKKRPKLSKQEVETLSAWINQGLAWESGFTFAEERYEPPLKPRRPDLPKAVDGRDHPIDRILDAYLAEQKVVRPEPISDAVFMRRLYLDVVGLLPTPEDLEAFLKNQSEDKRSKLTRDVLAKNEAYAQHWLSFWNDLLRNAYAGTGYIDGGRKQITGWLFKSLLENKPFDQFTRELIAPTPDSEGFIRGIKWRGNVNASQSREVQFAQSISQVFLGINMKCASCHDSFIDRWTLEEAYGLAAIYSTRPLEMYRCDKPTGKTAKAAWIFPELGRVDPEAKQPARLNQLAALMTHPDNGRFTRTIVNRIWQRLMGRGVVHPADAMHTEPWSEDLLDLLAVRFADHGHDLKDLIEFIVTSQAYQSRTTVPDRKPETGRYVFRGPITRRLTAEQFVDAIRQLTGTWFKPDAKAFKRDGRGQGGHLAAILDALDTPVQKPDKIPAQEALKKAKWIWSDSNFMTAPAGQSASFRKTFVRNKTGPVYAVFSADNTFELFVNKKSAAKGTDWQKPVVAEITQYLTPGTNSLVVRASNGGNGPNPAALIGCLLELDQDRNLIQIMATDASWYKAVEVAPAGAAPWGDIGKPAFSTNPGSPASRWGKRPIRAALTLGGRFQTALGRPNREQVVTARPDLLNTLEAINLANGQELTDLIKTSAPILLKQRGTSPKELVDWLYQFSLSRKPTKQEQALALEFLGPELTPRCVEDLLWTVCMLPEFQLNR